ncbi:hypothetical protein [Bosea sp. BIWAKO-01]|uniref:hypothetical protein n=1 Tax=Bosea sp. BIWAKO-01 TaxID=506668 RepID=UPI00114CBBDF|nr:hypothetical protein [Bosea sp. BIWAKO-01]
MNTHDLLAFSVAQEAINRISTGTAPWDTILSATSYITSSRSWPMPDFVLVDPTTRVTVGAEFKPPQQTKREYLTGLGQAISYSRDFHYGLLIVPSISDDGYRIADHVVSVLSQSPLDMAPIGVLEYNPATLSPTNSTFTESRFFSPRVTAPAQPAVLDQSFFAKWREMSPQEMLFLLSASYDAMRNRLPALGTIRDLAFDALWIAIQARTIHHWGGGLRTYNNTASNKVAVSKNYRNFLFHIGWTESDGSLTKQGLEALHVGTLYGHLSQPFLDAVATALLIEGKHLILFNAISEFQDTIGTMPSEPDWLNLLEETLELKGLLKRNPSRHAVATANSSRQFLKAEKQLWRNLGLIMPRGPRVFHPGRGFIFNWARIAGLLQSSD